MNREKTAAFNPHIQRVSGLDQITPGHIQTRPFEHPEVVGGQIEHIRHGGMRDRQQRLEGRLLTAKPGRVQVGKIVGRTSSAWLSARNPAHAA